MDKRSTSGPWQKFRRFVSQTYWNHELFIYFSKSSQGHQAHDENQQCKIFCRTFLRRFKVALNQPRDQNFITKTREKI
jgi:hypothetical protein